MRSLRDTSHTLEIFGPRNQGWRPATDEFLKEAQSLAYRGRLEQSIEAAQDAWISKNGHAWGVLFRIRTVTVELSGTGAFDALDCDEYPQYLKDQAPAPESN